MNEALSSACASGAGVSLLAPAQRTASAKTKTSTKTSAGGCDGATRIVAHRLETRSIWLVDGARA